MKIRYFRRQKREKPLFLATKTVKNRCFKRKKGKTVIFDALDNENTVFNAQKRKKTLFLAP